MPKYFNGLRAENGVFENETDNWNNEHKEEEERLKGGAYRLQKKNEFIPVEDLRSRGLNPEEESIAKEEGETDEYKERAELSEAPSNEILEQEQHEDNSNSAFEGVDEVIDLGEDKVEELAQPARRHPEVENLPKTEKLNIKLTTGPKQIPNRSPLYFSHGKRGRKREWPKSLKVRKRFNEIERESFEKANEIK